MKKPVIRFQVEFIQKNGVKLIAFFTLKEIEKKMNWWITSYECITINSSIIKVGK